MTFEDMIRFGLALILVLSLMGILGFIMRRINGGQQNFSLKDKRLSIIEQKMIDPRTKMVLIKRDDKEHLVILSQNGNTVIETGIASERTIQSAPSASVSPLSAVAREGRNKKDIRLEGF